MGSCLKNCHVISTLPLLMFLETHQSIFKITTLRAGAMLILGAPVMLLLSSFGILTWHIYYVLVFKSLQSWAPLQLFRKTFVVLSTYPGIIRQQICLEISFAVSSGDEIWPLAGEKTIKGEWNLPKCSLKTRKSDMQPVCWYNYEPSRFKQ